MKSSHKLFKSEIFQIGGGEKFKSIATELNRTGCAWLSRPRSISSGTQGTYSQHPECRQCYWCSEHKHPSAFHLPVSRSVAFVDRWFAGRPVDDALTDQRSTFPGGISYINEKYHKARRNNALLLSEWQLCELSPLLPCKRTCCGQQVVYQVWWVPSPSPTLSTLSGDCPLKKKVRCFYC